MILDIDPRPLMAQTARLLKEAGTDPELFWAQVFQAESPADAVSICHTWLRSL